VNFRLKIRAKNSN